MITSLSAYWRGEVGAASSQYSCGDAGSGSDEAEAEALGAPEEHPVWPRYFAVWGGEGATLADAQRKWRDSMRWRASVGQDECLRRPMPVFHLVKRHYAHCFHKTCRDGRVLVLERGDQFADLVAAFEAAEIDPCEAAAHVAALNDFFSTHLDPRPYPGGRAVRIFDCEQLSAWALGSSAVSFARAVARVLGPHYPERVSQVFIVNAPASFALAYNLMSPMMTRRLLDKVQLFSVSQTEEMQAALLAQVAPENLPRRYGGLCDCGGEGGCWRNAPEEQRLWSLVEATTPPEARK